MEIPSTETAETFSEKLTPFKVVNIKLPRRLEFFCSETVKIIQLELSELERS